MNINLTPTAHSMEVINRSTLEFNNFEDLKAACDKFDYSIGDIVKIRSNGKIEYRELSETIDLDSILWERSPGVTVYWNLVEVSSRKYTFGTIEEMKKAKYLKVGDVVELLGFYTSGDGAHHKRKISATDDGSGEVLSNGLYGCITHTGEVNVSWFGINGENDASKVQKAFLISNSIVFDIPLRVEQDIHMPPKSSLKGLPDIPVVMVGESTIYANFVTRVGEILFDLDKDYTGSVVTLHCMKFQQNYPQYSSTSNVVLSGNTVVANCTASDTSHLKARFLKIFTDGGGRNFYGVVLEKNNYVGRLNFPVYLKTENNGWITNLIMRDETGNGPKGIIELDSATLNTNIDFIFLTNVKFQKYSHTSNLAIIRNAKIYLDKSWLYDGSDDILVDNINEVNGSGSHIYFINSPGWHPEVNSVIYSDNSKGARKATINVTGGLTYPLDNYNLTDISSLILPGSVPAYFRIAGLPKDKSASISFNLGCTYGAAAYEIQKTTLCNCSLILQSTGHYSTSMPKFFKDKFDIDFFVANDVLDSNVLIIVLKVGNALCGAINLTPTFVSRYCEFYRKDKQGIVESDFEKLPKYQEHYYDFTSLFVAGGISTLDTPIYTSLMKKEGVYEDFETYMFAKLEYDAQQREIQAQQEANYKITLEGNPELSFEEFLSQQPMLLPVIPEPVPSEALLAFKVKYVG